MLEREIEVHTGEVSLAGTLCLPSEQGKFPCVLMIHGSGPVDRDENARQFKFITTKLNVFNTIAQYLAPLGIASLRYDKRGCGRSSGKYDEAGFHDLTADATAMYGFLTGQGSIRKESIFLLGHSEGTLIAPKIAVEYPRIAGLILLGAPVQNLGDALRYQAGKMKEDFEQGGGLNRRIVRLTWRLLGDPLSTQDALLERIKTSDEDSFRYKLQKINAKWLREHLNDSPAETMRNVARPTLVINGEKDIQVDPQDAVRIAELAKGDVEHHIVPNLTHILRADEGPPSILSYKKLVKMTMDYRVLELIGNWLQKTLQGMPAS
jgi:pimeloyl-ACP methyl ester carboxylesterase